VFRRAVRILAFAGAGLGLVACNNNGPVPLGDQARQATAGYLAGGDPTAASLANVYGSPLNGSDGRSVTVGPTVTLPGGTGSGGAVPVGPGAGDFCSAYHDFISQADALSTLATGNLKEAVNSFGLLDSDGHAMDDHAPSEIKGQADSLAQALDKLDAVVKSSRSGAQLRRRAISTGALQAFVTSSAPVLAYGAGNC